MRRSNNRIVVLSSNHVQIDDGRVFQRCSKPLVKAGYEVIQIGPYGRDYREIRDGVKIVGFKPRINLDIKHRWKPLWRIFRMALKTPARVYHCHELDALLVGFFIGFFRGARVIYDCHEYTNLLFAIGHFQNKLVQAIINRTIQLLEKVIAKTVYAVITAEQDVANSFLEVGCKRVMVLSNFPSIAIEQAKASTNLPKNEILTGIYIGGVNKTRGLIPTLKALRIALDGGLNINLRIVGPVKDDFVDPLHETITANRLEGYVNLKGRVPYEQMWAEMTKADFGVVMDPPFPFNLHATANKFYEYLSARLPVLASNLPIMREIYSELNFGYLVEPENPEAIALGMKKMASLSVSQRQKIGENNRLAFKKKYSWESIEPRLIELYRGIMGGKGD